MIDMWSQTFRQLYIPNFRCSIALQFGVRVHYGSMKIAEWLNL